MQRASATGRTLQQAGHFDRQDTSNGHFNRLVQQAGHFNRQDTLTGSCNRFVQQARATSMCNRTFVGSCNRHVPNKALLTFVSRSCSHKRNYTHTHTSHTHTLYTVGSLCVFFGSVSHLGRLYVRCWHCAYVLHPHPGLQGQPAPPQLYS